MNVNVACVQMYPKVGEKTYNLDKMEKFIDEIMAEKPETQLIVFPETITTGLEAEPEMFHEIAEKLSGGESIDRIGGLAEKYGVYIVYGFAERNETQEDTLYNSIVVIGKDGKPMGSYHKSHLFAPAETWGTGGNEYPLFETEFGKFGIIVCWDVAFPEVARIYALKGADFLIVCANWEDPYYLEWDPGKVNAHQEDWNLMVQARALDNTLHVIAANRIGDDGGDLSWFGRSMITDPRGRILQILDKREEGILYETLDLDKTPQYRKMYYTFLGDRRPETYGELVKPVADWMKMEGSEN